MGEWHRCPRRSLLTDNQTILALWETLHVGEQSAGVPISISVPELATDFLLRQLIPCTWCNLIENLSWLRIFVLMYMHIAEKAKRPERAFNQSYNTENSRFSAALATDSALAARAAQAVRIYSQRHIYILRLFFMKHPSLDKVYFSTSLLLW